MADVTTLTTRHIDTQAAGVDAFISDLNTPSAAMLKIDEETSEEARSQVLFSYTDDAEEEQPTDNTWGKKLNNFVERVKSPCVDGVDTRCGDWHIEIKKENKDEARDVVEEDEVKGSDADKTEEREVESEEKLVSEKEPIGDEGIKVTGMMGDGIKVTGMDAPSTEETETTEGDEPEKVESPVDNEVSAAETSEETWVDHISNQAQNMCSAISSITSPTCLLGDTATATPTEYDQEAEVIKVAELTEMALNGNHEDASIAKEVLGQVKQQEHEKQFSIVEDAKKFMESIATQAKSTWTFLSQKFGILSKSNESTQEKEDVNEEKTVKTDAPTIAKTVKTEAPTIAKTEAPTAKDDTPTEDSATIPDDITTPGLVNDVSSLQESII
jgi:hypothetical protein